MGAPARVDPNSLGGRMRMLRKAFGISQQVLAERAHVSQPAVSLWERGTASPTDESLRRVAQALNTTPHYLDPNRFLVQAS